MDYKAKQLVLPRLLLFFSVQVGAGRMRGIFIRIEKYRSWAHHITTVHAGILRQAGIYDTILAVTSGFRRQPETIADFIQFWAHEPYPPAPEGDVKSKMSKKHFDAITTEEDRLASGVRLALAPRVLCDIYRGPEDMTLGKDGLMKTQTYFPAHGLFVWLGYLETRVFLQLILADVLLASYRVPDGHSKATVEVDQGVIIPYDLFCPFKVAACHSERDRDIMCSHTFLSVSQRQFGFDQGIPSKPRAMRRHMKEGGVSPHWWILPWCQFNDLLLKRTVFFPDAEPKVNVSYESKAEFLNALRGKFPEIEAKEPLEVYGVDYEKYVDLNRPKILLPSWIADVEVYAFNPEFKGERETNRQEGITPTWKACNPVLARASETCYIILPRKSLHSLRPKARERSGGLNKFLRSSTYQSSDMKAEGKQLKLDGWKLALQEKCNLLLVGPNRHQKKEQDVQQEEQLKLPLPLQMDLSLQHFFKHIWPVKHLKNLFPSPSYKGKGIFSSARSTLYILKAITFPSPI
ncbi:hypothetical protein ACLOJK_014895 [Asimina triloba]